MDRDPERILEDILKVHLSPQALSDHMWETKVDQWWIRAHSPLSDQIRMQGWKLHISATILSAPSVLNSVLPAIVQRRCDFKFARSLEVLSILNSPNYPPEAAGKFITIYPNNDIEALDLAKDCHLATQDLAGPRILSDRPFRQESLVHFRYGAFQGERRFQDGVLSMMIRDPSGNLTEDTRRPWFSPPEWAVSPFDEGEFDEWQDTSMGLLIDKYHLTHAIKRTNKGGVYRGTIAMTNRSVVVKEARPHIATDKYGRDAKFRLRREFTLLKDLPRNGYTPIPLDYFEIDDHAFLVEEDLSGVSLRSSIGRRYVNTGLRPSEEKLRSSATRLTQILESCHGAGIIVRDFTPNNLVVSSANVMALVDLEAAHLINDPWLPELVSGTVAYRSPQQAANFPPHWTDDIYSLGGILYFLATLVDPLSIEDSLGGRSIQEKLFQVLNFHKTPSWLIDLIHQCRSNDPGQRPSLVRILKVAKSTVSVPHLLTPQSKERNTQKQSDSLAKVVSDVVHHMNAKHQPGNLMRPWTTTEFGNSTHWANVQNGLAGVGLFLNRVYRRGISDSANDLLISIVGQIKDCTALENHIPPGLYFGASGTAWFLADAADTLGDYKLAGAARLILSSVPAVVPNPDISHGTAGLGLAAIRLWHSSQTEELHDRIEIAAEALVAQASITADGASWSLPMEGVFSGKTYHGFAHGTAGIAYFLLCASNLTGNKNYGLVACQGLDELLIGGAQHVNERQMWPITKGGLASDWTWCKGIAGIGTALLRGFVLTGNERYREGAIECGKSLRNHLYPNMLSQCHGLSGTGEFFLDLAQILKLNSFRESAWHVARLILIHLVDYRSVTGGVCFPDESGASTGVDFMTGFTGVAAFLLRLATDGRRDLMLDREFRLERSVQDG